MRFAWLRYVGTAIAEATATSCFRFCPHTLSLGPEAWRVLAKCHDLRNLGEYEGDLDIDERIVLDLTAACRAVADKMEALSPPTA